ncbi:MAG TPA: carboxypeptidase regulatory-like domain-containing protein, partial [Pyrinomonadaceae bacterium]|nr:carboxypeptidase regulatory-like domain-containing protein [Pyrinomonadaceae bacterium]
VQDAGEANYSGVTVQLWADTDSNGTVDTQVGTAVTDANGEYYFVSSTVADPNTTDNIGQINGGIISGRAYQVRIPASNFNTGQPLNNRLRTPNDNDATTNGDSRDSDGIASSGNVIANFVAGSAGSNNHTFDFGFYLAPTAATVPVGGRIQAADGVGIRNVIVNLVLPNGTVQSTRTGAFGYYRFDDIEVGQTVTVEVRAKRFTFKQPTRIFTLEEAMEDLDFTAIE